MGLVVLRLGIAARMFSLLLVGVSWRVGASRDEGKVATDDNVARSTSEDRSTGCTTLFLRTVFGEPLKAKLIWVR